MDISKVEQFLFESNPHTYADEGVKTIEEADGSHTIIYEKGNLKLHDNYFGGEPFGGRTVIFEDGKPIWMMVYYGSIFSKDIDFSEVYKFLRRALRESPKEAPYRGPSEFKDGDWLYSNRLGMEDSGRFSGEEMIIFQGDIVYSAEYHGGLVDVRKE